MPLQAIKLEYQECTPQVAADLLQKLPTERSPAEVDRLSFFLSKRIALFDRFSKAMRLEVRVGLMCVWDSNHEVGVAPLEA